MNIDILKLRQAIEASWLTDTAYLGAYEAGNPALGQCYPTSRVVQHYFPEVEIVEGEVLTSKGSEKHFWNVFVHNGAEVHVDFTWRQFPTGSEVKEWHIRDRSKLNDGPESTARVELMLQRVAQSLSQLS